MSGGKKTMPKGGKKGGARYPHIDLEKAINYAKKLVSKTHTAPQPAEIILPGVFDSTTGSGRVRASALRQFDLMEGDTTAYKASALAKKIVSATPDDLTTLSQQACLKPVVFNKLYETFKNDHTTVAKIKQQASKLSVHPDLVDNCTDIFIKCLSVNKIYFLLVLWYRFSRMTSYVTGRNHGQYTVLGSLGCVLGQGGAADPSAGT